MNRKELLKLLKNIIGDMTTKELMELKMVVFNANKRILDEELARVKETASTSQNPKNSEINETIIAYVDGSFDKDKKLCGSGIVFLNDIDDKESMETISFLSEDKYNMWNIQGECEACIKAVEVAIDKGCNEIHIYHDYQGISSWAKREWKTKNDYTKGYVKRFDELSKKINIEFVKVKGHSKDKWNDEADRLAKMSLGK